MVDRVTNEMQCQDTARVTRSDSLKYDLVMRSVSNRRSTKIPGHAKRFSIEAQSESGKRPPILPQDASPEAGKAASGNCGGRFVLVTHK